MARRRVHLRRVVQEAFHDETNEPLMKSFSQEQIEDITRAVVKKAKEILISGVDVVWDDFGVMRIKYPKKKERRFLNVSTGKMDVCKQRPSILFVQYFDIADGDKHV